MTDLPETEMRTTSEEERLAYNLYMDLFRQMCVSARMIGPSHLLCIGARFLGDMARLGTDQIAVETVLSLIHQNVDFHEAPGEGETFH